MSTTVQTRQVSEGGVTRSVASQSDARFGNTRKVTADNQAVSGTFVYDAFGTLTYSSGSPGLRNRYCGNWGYRDDGDTFASLSASAGLLHVGARYYDPTTGRFTTRDTLLTEHPYVYCDGDPVNAVDPDGHLNLKKICLYVGVGALCVIGAALTAPAGGAGAVAVWGLWGAVGGAVGAARSYYDETPPESWSNEELAGNVLDEAIIGGMLGGLGGWSGLDKLRPWVNGLFTKHHIVRIPVN